MDIVFLSLDEILDIHRDQVERYGGILAIRDLNLLKSATAMPNSTFDGNYLHGDLFEMAAAYLFHIVQNHPFVDGNKRTGVAATLVFLLMNGVEIDTDANALETLVRDVATGKGDKAAVAQFLQAHASGC